MLADSSSKRAKELFTEATERPPTERDGFLDEACGDDTDLRKKVQALLKAHDRAQKFLETPPVTDVPGDLDEALAADEAALLGERISQYRLDRVIATGGMGTVYQAEQEQPRRTVAVKVMRRGIASKSALRRFEYESQILARLRHPGIAQVLEAGTCDQFGGTPYFVMEYIPKARPITTYAAENNLSLRQRLELFAKVCEAVHYGHQRGIIHRDLKPANVLIDADGDPKVIDFGVARATDSDIAMTTLQTDVGQLLGTLQYMSPEQCWADPDDLDIRSDVYSLGVVLYELLCEQLPYDITHAPVPEAVRTIREQVPTKPSTISKTLRGDVETILLKALEKVRDRRYLSAADLAADIDRYLSHEPITARPPSAVYQFRKFARRNRGLVGGAVAVLLVLVGATIVSTRLYFLTDQARAEATRQTKIADAVNEFLNDDLLAAVSPAELGRDLTMRQALDAAAQTIEGKFPDEPLVEASIRMTLGTTYKHLGHHDVAEPHLREAIRLRAAELGEDDPITLESSIELGLVYVEVGRFDEAEQALARSLERCRSSLGDEHPLTILAVLAQTYLYVQLGRYTEVEELLVKTVGIARRVLGVDHPHTLEALHGLAVAYRNQRRLDDAESLYLEVLEIRQRTLGEEHPSTLVTMGDIGSLYLELGRYDEAEQLLLETVEIRRRTHGMDHQAAFGMAMDLATLYCYQGRYKEAEPLYIEALASARRVLNDEHPLTLTIMHNLAQLYSDLGQLEEAEVLYREVVESRQRLLGPQHDHTLVSTSNLGVLYLHQRRFEEAEPLLVQVLEAQQSKQGDGHTNTLATMHSLAGLYREQRRYDEAERLFTAALDSHRRAFGEAHPLTPMFMSSLANVYRDQRRYQEAQELYLPVLERQRQELGATHLQTLATANNLARMYKTQSRFQEAQLLYVQVLEARHEVLSEEHPHTLSTMSNLADVFVELGRHDEAEPLYLQALESRRRVLGEEHADTLTSMYSLARLYSTLDHHDKAEPILRGALEVRRRILPEGDPAIATSLVLLGMALNAQDKHAQAEPLLRECLDIRKMALPADHWLIFNTMSVLGEALVGEGGFEKAEPLLLDGYARLAADPDTPEIRKQEALDRVIRLYDSWVKPDEAAQWRAKLPERTETGEGD